MVATATAEGIFEALEQKDRQRLGNALAERIRESIVARYRIPCAVLLVNMAGDALGQNGEMESWNPRTNA